MMPTDALAFIRAIAMNIKNAPVNVHDRTWARHLWVLPLLLSLLFVMAVSIWLQRTDTIEREERRQIMIADALTLESQLHGQLESEVLQLDDIARQVQTGSITPKQLAADANVNAGLNRLWQSPT